MKYLLIYMLLLSSCTKSLHPNASSKDLELTFLLKNKYLTAGDFKNLKSVLHPKIDYCHSNCWIEDFNSMIQDEKIKKLDYINIDVKELNIKIVQNVGIVRGKADFHVNYNEKEMVLSLCFVETYIYENNKWLLLTRQAAKIA